jgi:hypothetical protein
MIPSRTFEQIMVKLELVKLFFDYYAFVISGLWSCDNGFLLQLLKSYNSSKKL